jgi:hypothetical protein
MFDNAQQSIMLDASWPDNGAVSREGLTQNDTPPTFPFPHLPRVAIPHLQPEAWTNNQKHHMSVHYNLFSTPILPVLCRIHSVKVSVR